MPLLRPFKKHPCCTVRALQLGQGLNNSPELPARIWLRQTLSQVSRLLPCDPATDPPPDRRMELQRCAQPGTLHLSPFPHLQRRRYNCNVVDAHL